MTDTFSTAVLGTGIMGAAMARNLLRAGHRVTVWNRTAARAEPLAADGARVAADPADAVEGADAVVTMLLDGPTVEAVVRAAAPALRPGTVWLQMSTVGPEALAPLTALAADTGLTFYDAPVLGTKAPAENGQLQVLAAGPREGRETAARVFDAVGRQTRWLGEDAAAGAASRLKLVLNSWVLSVVNGTADALALAEGLGVDPRDFLGAVEGGALDSPYLRAKARAVLDGDWEAGFPLSGAAKDAALIARAAALAGLRLETAEASAARYARAVEEGHGDKDMAAVYLASTPR